MSHKLISHNTDLKKLRDEGYEVEIINSHLLMRSVPDVNSRKKITLGVLVAPLGDMAGGKTSKPQDHVIYFIGEHPCDYEGNILKGIQHASQKITLAEGLEVEHSFSNKPTKGFDDYYEKMVSYVNIITSQAQAIDSSITAKTFKVINSTDDQENVFNYLDTNSSRAEIQAMSEKLKNLKIAIIGLGGTGSYILDFVAKTHVKEIHIFDKDFFLSHNAFRAPGAVSCRTLEKKPKKVEHLSKEYSKMHKYIFPHEFDIASDNLKELDNMNFVFICIDKGENKKIIIQKLIEFKIPFVDVGMGISIEGDAITGSLRITTGTLEKNDRIEEKISFAKNVDDDYNKNIQIAELNALNAALAVIKWKKIFGFYHDLEREHDTVYNINCNQLLNDGKINP